MPKTEFKTKGTDDKVASVGDLDWPEVKAILQTMAEDKTLVLHKLEIRKKNNGTWRVIVRATKEKNK